MIVCAIDDLIFSIKISTAARHLGVDVCFVRDPAQIVTSVRDKQPRLVIFDLNSAKLRPLDAIEVLRQDAELRSIATLGFVAHVDGATIAAARAAGIGQVLARSAFTDCLGDILTGA